MSEREVRKRVETAIKEYDSYEHDPVLGPRYQRGIAPLKQALLAEPDVVVLLRKLGGTIRAHSTPTRPIVEVQLDVLIQRIEELFHVRLTADGWKWVE